MGNIISSNTSNIIYNKVVFWSKSLSILPFYKFVVTKTLQKLQVQRHQGALEHCLELWYIGELHLKHFYMRPEVNSGLRFHFGVKFHFGVR